MFLPPCKKTTDLIISSFAGLFFNFKLMLSTKTSLAGQPGLVIEMRLLVEVCLLAVSVLDSLLSSFLGPLFACLLIRNEGYVKSNLLSNFTCKTWETHCLHSAFALRVGNCSLSLYSLAASVWDRKSGETGESAIWGKCMLRVIHIPCTFRQIFKNFSSFLATSPAR